MFLPFGENDGSAGSILLLSKNHSNRRKVIKTKITLLKVKVMVKESIYQSCVSFLHISHSIINSVASTKVTSDSYFS